MRDLDGCAWAGTCFVTVFTRGLASTGFGLAGAGSTAATSTFSRLLQLSTGVAALRATSMRAAASAATLLPAKAGGSAFSAVLGETTSVLLARVAFLASLSTLVFYTGFGQRKLRLGRIIGIGAVGLVRRG